MLLLLLLGKSSCAAAAGEAAAEAGAEAEAGAGREERSALLPMLLPGNGGWLNFSKCAGSREVPARKHIPDTHLFVYWSFRARRRYTSLCAHCVRVLHTRNSVLNNSAISSDQ